MSATQLSFDTNTSATLTDQDAAWTLAWAEGWRYAVNQLADYLSRPDPREQTPGYPRDLYDEWVDDGLTGHR